MKILPNDTIKNIIDSGNFIGGNKPNGRVTVEPYWGLTTTDDSYGGAQRGPYRWFLPVDGDVFEIVVPNIEKIDINRNIDQPIASCSISMYNQWHNLNTEEPELLTQLGKPGYFWFERGRETDEESIQVSRWNQSIATGAYDKDGNYLDDFTWDNVLVPNGLLRTYQGYGGHDLSISDALAAGNLTQTGVWIIDRISAGSDGMMNIECRDIGRLLTDQRIQTPLVPSELYPLQYVPPGSDEYDSPWTPTPKTVTGQPPPTVMSVAIAPFIDHYSSAAIREGDFGVESTVDGHSTSAHLDQLGTTWTWSQATDNPKDHTDFWQMVTPHIPTAYPYLINQIQIKPYGGGYTMYVSISEDGSTWEVNGDGTLVPEGIDEEYSRAEADPRIPYVAKYPVPKAAIGEERTITYDLPNTYNAVNVRVSFRHHTITDGGYRCGIREFRCLNSVNYVGDGGEVYTGDDFAADIAAHPYDGWYGVTGTGKVFTSHPSNSIPSVGPVHHGDGVYSLTNPVVAITAHPLGIGYWLLHADGDIEAKGACDHFGEQSSIGYDPNDGPLGAYSLKAMGMACTPSGDGYWVIYSNGVIHGFGEVGGYIYETLPLSAETVYMEALSSSWPLRYEQKRGTAIAAHPIGIGFWAADGCGRITAYGAADDFGEYENRVYAAGSANSFRLALSGEYIDSLEATSTGNGYWATSGSGRIGQFGDAVGRGPIDVYASIRNDAIPSDPYTIPTPEVLKSLYRSLMQGLCRMPGDTGFYIVMGSGTVACYGNDWWGHDSWWGKGGYKWHSGLYSDYVEIWKELLAWAGFTLGPENGGEAEGSWGAEPEGVGGLPPVHAFLESTGIHSDSKIGFEQIDKQTILDVITMIKEVVAYIMFIDDNGAVHIASPNWWKAGNYITASIGSDDSTWTSEIPIIDERIDMMTYSATADAESILSEIIVGSVEPRFTDPTATSYYRYESPNANIPIKSDFKDALMSRGIVRQVTWTSEMLSNAEEQKLMAELIALHAFFAQRTGSVRAVGNPAIQINDQVKLIERNTSEAYVHYVRGIDSSMNLDSGEYTMNLTTNWMGTTNGDWVITRDNITDPFGHIQISERVDAWQEIAGHGFDSGHLGDVDVSMSTPYTDVFFGGNQWDEYTYDFKPSTNPTPDGYFWAFQVGWANSLGENVGGGYVGMQNLGTGLPGKCVVFSIAEGAIEADAPPGAIVDEDFDGGLGISTRVTYAWSIGTKYRFTLSKGTADVDGLWWNATITNLTTSAVSDIASIKVPLDWTGLNGYGIAFTERYSGDLTSCSVIRKAIGEFTRFRADGESPTHYVDHINIGGCDNASITVITDGRRHTVGTVLGSS